MIEVQLKDKSFKTINPDMIVEMESNKKKKIIDSRTGVEYEVNDYQTGDEFTIIMLNNKTYTLSKLGLDILRKAQARGDFDPNMFHSMVRF